MNGKTQKQLFVALVIAGLMWTAFFSDPYAPTTMTKQISDLTVDGVRTTIYQTVPVDGRYIIEWKCAVGFVVTLVMMVLATTIVWMDE